MNGNTRGRARSGSNLSIGSNNEKLSHKEALTKKFDVITQKQADNICIADLGVTKEVNGKNNSVIDHKAPPKGLENMGNT